MAVSIEPGTRLGSYEVQEFIGQGAMGLVYRAYHPQLERYGAVKVLQGIASTPDAAARFRHEAQAIAQMRHPNIVNVYDFGEYEGTPYMIVEYVPGGNLASKMEQKPLDRPIALRYLRGMAAGLDYAHSLGIVHRDVKPGNVLLENDETPVLADFGLVKLLQGSSIQSMTGVTTGTPAYMAPEQVTGHEVGPAADRYSLATIAYEMLTGVIPFDGDGVLELLYAHVHREPTAPSTRNAALTPAVDAVILRGLAKAPEARWETATAFVDALTAALAGEPPQPREATVRMAAPPVVAGRPLAPDSSRAATVAMAMPSASVSGPPPLNPTSRRRRIYEIVAGAVIVLLLLAVGGVCAAAEFQPAMSIDPTIAVPGDTVTVTATRLPANQSGQIQLHSTEIFVFAFQADSRGDIHRSIVIPASLRIGTHVVSICWSQACPLQKSLRIVAPGNLPAPSSSPSPASTGRPGSTPSPRRSPRPGSSPTANPTSSPSPKPTSSPKATPTPRPSPSPTSNPCPTPTGGATLSGPGTVNSGSTFTATGANFTPGRTVTVSYYDPAGASTPTTTKTTTVLCDGSFSVSFKAATLLLGLSARNDKVTAIDSAGRNSSYGFKLNPVI